MDTFDIPETQAETEAAISRHTAIVRDIERAMQEATNRIQKLRGGEARTRYTARDAALRKETLREAISEIETFLFTENIKLDRHKRHVIRLSQQLEHFAARPRKG